MGLAQKIRFNYKNDELIKVLENIGFLRVDNGYAITTNDVDFFIAIEDYGLYSHRSGSYYEILGTLIEALGYITTSITIEDH